MTFSKTLSALLLTSGLSYASSLAVYQDSTFYTYSPTSSFIGFTKNVSAKCEGSSVGVVPMMHCPDDARLCQTYLGIQTLKQDLLVNQSNVKVLDKLISLPKPTTIDAEA